MTARELRRMNREELLELLIRRTDEAEALRERLNEAEKRADEVEQRGEERSGGAEETGRAETISPDYLSEIAAQTTQMFEAAEKTANIYLEQIQEMQEAQARANLAAQAENERIRTEIEKDARVQATLIEEQARREAEERIREAELQADQIRSRAAEQAARMVEEAAKQRAEHEEEARSRCEEMLAEASRDSGWRLFALSEKVEQIIQENAELRAMLEEQTTKTKKRKWGVWADKE